MTHERISPMAYATVLNMAQRNYTTDKGPWLWMVCELGWERDAAWFALMDASDPFQDALPCWDHKSATAYAIRTWQVRQEWRERNAAMIARSHKEAVK